MDAYLDAFDGGSNSDSDHGWTDSDDADEGEFAASESETESGNERDVESDGPGMVDLDRLQAVLGNYPREALLFAAGAHVSAALDNLVAAVGMAQQQQHQQQQQQQHLLGPAADAVEEPTTAAGSAADNADDAAQEDSGLEDGLDAEHPLYHVERARRERHRRQRLFLEQTEAIASLFTASSDAAEMRLHVMRDIRVLSHALLSSTPWTADEEPRRPPVACEHTRTVDDEASAHNTVARSATGGRLDRSVQASLLHRMARMRVCNVVGGHVDAYLPSVFHLIPFIETLRMPSCSPPLRSFCHRQPLDAVEAGADAQSCSRSSLGHCVNLRVVSVAGNQIVSLIGIKSIADGLRNVEEFDLSYNPLRTLRVSELDALPRLRILDLRSTRHLSSLFDLAHAVANSVPHLEELWFQMVCTGVARASDARPRFHSASVEELTQARTLAFWPNQADTPHSCRLCRLSSTPLPAATGPLESQVPFHFVVSSAICARSHYRLMFEFVLGSRSSQILLDGIPIVRQGDPPMVGSAAGVPASRREVELFAAQYFPTRSMAQSRPVSRTYRQRTVLAVPGKSTPFRYQELFPRDEHNIDEDLLPRQFEYHPTIPSRLVFGSLGGALSVVNVERNREIARYAEVGRRGMGSSVLGISWLHTTHNSDRFLCGVENGQIHSFRMCSNDDDSSRLPYRLARTSHVGCYQIFPHLTSVNTNCDDSLALICGHSRGTNPNLRLDDINSGTTVRSYHAVHAEYVNVSKFAHTTPHIFASSSFDCTVKVWDVRTQGDRPAVLLNSVEPVTMCVWSPDDRFLLSSSIDNEVRQYCTLDGLRRAHLELDGLGAGSSIFDESRTRQLDIARLHSDENYSRAYYMDGGKHIIIGSCGESVVSVYDSDFGKCVRTVEMSEMFFPKSRGISNNLLRSRRLARPFVQSLRGAEFEPLTFSALLYNNEGAVAGYGHTSPAILAHVQLLPGNFGAGADPVGA